MANRNKDAAVSFLKMASRGKSARHIRSSSAGDSSITTLTLRDRQRL